MTKAKRLPLIAGLMCTLGANGVYAEEDIRIYTQLSDRFDRATPSFNLVIYNSLDNLARFKPQQAAQTLNAEALPLEQRLQQASQAQTPYVAEVALTDQTNDGGWLSSSEQSTRLDVTVYESDSTSPIFSWSRDYPQTAVMPLISSLESELPLELKRRFKEVGNIVKKDSQMVYFDLGTAAGVQTGDLYRVFRRGQELTNGDGESFGWLEDNSGVIRVVDTQSTYATAEILLGRLSIEESDYVEKMPQLAANNFQGEILSVLDNKVAINLGKQVGVSEGSYYAVFKDIKAINGDESFREVVGEIRISDVYDDFSTGELSLSNHYSLAKAMVKEGDPVEEIAPSRQPRLTIGQISANAVGSGETEEIYFVGYEQDSQNAIDLTYRGRLGFGDDVLASAGIMSSIGHSNNFFYGIDVLYLDGAGANLFLSVDIPTPFSDKVGLNLETGYIVGTDDKYEGLEVTLGLKFPLGDLF